LVDNKDNTRYKDGSLSGIDYIEYNPDLLELYYDAKARSVMPSEIHRAIRRSVYPLYGSDEE